MVVVYLWIHPESFRYVDEVMQYKYILLQKWFDDDDEKL